MAYPTYREIKPQYPSESSVSVPPLATFAGGGGGVILSAGASSALGGAFTFANSNNVSFGLSGAVITASVNPGGGVMISAGTELVSTGTLVFSNSNQISFGLNNSILTASYSQSNQPFYFSASGGQSTVSTLSFVNSNGFTFRNSNGSIVGSYTVPTVTNSSATVSVFNRSELVDNLVFSNDNNVSFGLTGGTITASASYSANTAFLLSNSNGFSFGTNGSTVTISGSKFSFSNAHNVTFGTNGSTVTASASFSQSVQTQGSVLVNGSSGSVVFSNSNGFTFGGNASTITGSYTVPTDYVSTAQSSLFQQTSLMSNYLGTTYTSHTHSQYLNTSQSSLFRHSSADSQLQFTSQMSDYLGTGYTTHTHTQSNQALSGSNGSFTFQTATFGNLNGLSFYSSNGSMVGSYTVPTQTAYVFSNSNNVSFGTNASTITASASFAQSNQNIGLYAVSNTTQSTSATVDARSISFMGAGIVSVGASNGSIIISASAAGAADGVNIIAAGTQTANSTGTVMFSNSNNVTFGMTNSSIITASFSQSVDTGKAGTGFTSAGNNIGISGTLNTNGLSLSATVAAQTNQTVGLYALGNTTQNSSTTLDARTLSFNALGGMTWGYSNGSIQASVPATSSLSATGAVSISVNAGTISIGAPVQTNQTIGLYASSQTTGQSSSSTVDARSLSFRGAGIVSVGLSGGEYIISATGGAGGGLAAVYDGANSISSGTIRFTNANGVSFTINGQTISGSVATNYQSQGAYLTTAAQSTQTLAFSLGGNTATTNSSVAANGGFILAGGNGVTLQQSNNSISVSVATNYQSQGAYLTTAAQSTQTHAFTLSGNIATTNSSVIGPSGGYALAGGNGVTIQQSNNTVSFSVATNYQSQGAYLTTAAASNHSHGNPTLALTNLTGTTASASNGFTISLSAAAPGAAAENNNINLLGANTAGNTTASGSTIGWSGINLTLSGTNASIVNISAPATSSLSGTGAVSISVNGSTISIGAPQMATLSRFEYPNEAFTTIGAYGQGSLSLNRVYIPFNVSGSAARLAVSVASLNLTSATTATLNLSLWMGIYTLNGSNLSLASSGSANNSVRVSQSASSSANSSVTGLRELTVPMNVNMTPGVYWMGAVISSGTVGGLANNTISLFGNSVVGQTAWIAPFGDTTAGRLAFQMQGIYTAGTSAGPSSIGTSAINQTSATNMLRANYYFQIYNASY